MSTPTLPEISVQELERRLKEGQRTIILDVREPQELELANLGWDKIDPCPLSVIGEKREAALPPPVRDKDAPIVVLCHHGMRSAQVTMWLLSLGYTDVHNLAGGIDAYARQINPDVGMY